MKYANSLRSGILGTILFLFLVCVGINVCVDRSSKAADYGEEGFVQGGGIM